MKSPHTRRSKKASRNHGRTPADDSHARHSRHLVVRGKTTTALAEREERARRGEDAPGVKEGALRARHASAQTRAEVERLMDEMREANERLIVSAVSAQDLSDEARAEAAQARLDLEDLMRQLQDANERSAAAAAQAHAMAEEARRHEEDYRRLSVRLLQSQDEERRRLAVDLHDSTAQCLAALIMNLDLVDGARKGLDVRARRALVESRSLAKQCSRQVRTFAYLLHPPLLEEMGLVSAVRWYAEGFSKRSGIHVVMNLGEVGRLPAAIETALFRIVQESLTNVHRHASASSASIRLTSTADAVVLEIQDQGHGLRDDLTRQGDAPLRETLGVGIQGMRERIRQLAGTFDVEFTDKGTTVRVVVPLGKGTP